MNPATESLRRLYGPERAPFGPTRTWALHARLVHAIAVLPGGALFVSSSEDGTVRVVSLADGRVVQQLDGHAGPVNSLCSTPDGARLVTGGDDHTVRVWDTSSWQVQHVLREHTAYVREVAASDSVIVSGAEDNTVRFWDLASGRLSHVGEAHREHLRTVAIAPDGRLAASSGLDNRLILWDVARGEPLRTLYDADATVLRPTSDRSTYLSTGNDTGRGHQDGPRQLRFLDGGRTLVSTENDVLFWDVATGEETRRWPRWGWLHDAVASHPEGRLLALGGNGYVQIWDVAAGALVTTFGRGGEHVYALAFTPDGRWLLAGTAAGAVQLWDVEAGLRAEDGCPHQHSIAGLVTHGSRALTSDTGGGVVLWDLETPAPLRALDVEREANGRALALGEGVALTAESEGFAVWDAQTGELRRRLRSEPGADEPSPTPHALWPLTGDRALVGHLGEGLSLWTLGEGGAATPLIGATRQNKALAVSPDQRHAVSRGYFARAEDRARAGRGSGDDYVYVPSVTHLQGWDLETRSLLWTVAAGRAGDSYVDFVFSLFTPDGRLVTRSPRDERTLVFWDVRTGTAAQNVELPNPPMAARVVGRELVMLIDNDDFPRTARWIDLGTGRFTRETAFERLGRHPSFSPDGSRIAASEGSRLVVYDTDTGEQVASHECGLMVRELSFSDDGRRIVLGDQAGRVHIFALAGYEPRPIESWTPEELAAVRRQTEARVAKKQAAADRAAVKRTAAAEKKSPEKKVAAPRKPRVPG